MTRLPDETVRDHSLRTIFVQRWNELLHRIDLDENRAAELRGVIFDWRDNMVLADQQHADELTRTVWEGEDSYRAFQAAGGTRPLYEAAHAEMMSRARSILTGDELGWFERLISTIHPALLGGELRS